MNSAIAARRNPAPAARASVSDRIALMVLAGFAPLEEGPREAAVDGNHSAGHVTAAVRSQEADHVRDLLRPAEAAERDLLQIGRPRALRVDLHQPRRLDSAWGDRVDRDLLRPELARHGLRPADHPGPDCVREGEVVDRLTDRARGDVDDPAVPAPLELRPAQLGQAEHRKQQQLDGALDVLGGEPDGRTARRTAAVVDQDVDAAEGPDSPVDATLHARR